MMYDIIIIGAGPAGISASLYVKMANKNVLVLYYGEANLEKAVEINNYYGIENSISGKELYERGIKQAKNNNIDIKKEEVLNIEKIENNFNVKTENANYTSKALIIATGDKKIKPNIDGIEEFEGKGISYCAICDGFFYKEKSIAVIGNGKYAINEANHLKNVTNNIIILTNGLEMKNNTNFNVNTKKINKIIGNTKVTQIEFEDGAKIDIDGVFVALGEAGGSDFAKKLGVVIDKNNIVVDENMKTNLDGLFACGNATGGLLQVSKAVYEGTVAGLSAIKYVNNIQKEREEE